MPKLSDKAPGKRVNVYLPNKHLKIAKEIGNLSNFVQISLDQAASILAFDIIKQAKGLTQQPPTPEAIERFNHDHPLNPLTEKRENKQWPKTNSQPKPELW